MDNHCIYMHTSPSGKSYIGQTANYKDRCYRHQNTEGKAVGAAIKKYGWDSFAHAVLIDGLSQDDAKPTSWRNSLSTGLKRFPRMAIT